MQAFVVSDSKARRLMMWQSSNKLTAEGQISKSPNGTIVINSLEVVGSSTQPSK